MVKDIAFTAYPAKDVAALRSFYADNLGLKFGLPYEENGSLLYDEAEVGHATFAVMTEEWYDLGRSGSVAFEIDDIEKALADLKAKGVRTEEIHDTPVCRLGSFYDPEGNKVTLHERK